MELEKIIEKGIGLNKEIDLLRYNFWLGATKELAQKIREAGYHRHESEYCSCDPARENLSSFFFSTYCKYCRLPFRPTPKRKRIEPIDYKNEVSPYENRSKINEIIDRLNERV